MSIDAGPDTLFDNPQDSLSRPESDAAIDFSVPRVEIVTVGYWGKQAAELRDDLLEGSQTIEEYYTPFESGSNRLTLNSDGIFWIFAGTAPDRRLVFTGQDFGVTMECFFQDPITHLLVDEGMWAPDGNVVAPDLGELDAADLFRGVCLLLRNASA